jgi:hypothetical protein
MLKPYNGKKDTWHNNVCYEINTNLAQSTILRHKTQNTVLDIWHLNSHNTRVLAVYTGALKYFLNKLDNTLTFLIYYIYFNTIY